MSRFSFIKRSECYLALLRETESINPFSVPTAKSISLWDEVAVNLQSCPLQMKVTGRSCRERVSKLIAEFKGDESRSLKA